ncbi:hypothetical protein D3C73_1072340 [compost metagenome]
MLPNDDNAINWPSDMFGPYSLPNGCTDRNPPLRSHLPTHIIGRYLIRINRDDLNLRLIMKISQQSSQDDVGVGIVTIFGYDHSYFLSNIDAHTSFSLLPFFKSNNQNLGDKKSLSSLTVTVNLFFINV